jgi:hypothetical protein
MRRKKTFKRGRIVAVLVAGGLGYVIGGWQSPALTGINLSAAQSVALRFPEDWNDASPAIASAVPPAEGGSSASTMGNAQFALLNPEPMMTTVREQAAQPASAQMAALEEAKPALASAPEAHTQPPTPVVAAAPVRPVKAATVAAHRSINRPGYLLDDAQIASIKQRLRLTPDQEAMWPAVEAALRNIAYAKTPEARRLGNTTVTQAASIDPNSAEVQGLKSAAVPLIMSFNYEQKEEVRNLAHVMGLDRLAAQF